MKPTLFTSTLVLATYAQARCEWVLKSGDKLEKSITITVEEPRDHHKVPQCFQHRDGGCFMSMLIRDYCRISDIYTWGCGIWQMDRSQWQGYPDDGPYAQGGSIEVGTVAEGKELMVGDVVIEGRRVEDEDEEMQGEMAAREAKTWTA